jgi:hypothetical protein
MLHKILSTDSSKTTILIRPMVSAVFLSEGIQKFLFADKNGAGRFAKIELPSPDLLGSLSVSLKFCVVLWFHLVCLRGLQLFL